MKLTQRQYRRSRTFSKYLHKESTFTECDDVNKPNICLRLLAKAAKNKPKPYSYIHGNFMLLCVLLLKPKILHATHYPEELSLVLLFPIF